jgi:hypothetical protein
MRLFLTDRKLTELPCRFASGLVSISAPGETGATGEDCARKMNLAQTGNFTRK